MPLNASVFQGYLSDSYPSVREDGADVRWFFHLNLSNQTPIDRTVHTHHDWLIDRNYTVKHNIHHYNLRTMHRVRRLPTQALVNAYGCHLSLQQTAREQVQHGQNPADSAIEPSPTYVCHIVYWRGELPYQALSPLPYSSNPYPAGGRHLHRRPPIHVPKQVSLRTHRYR